MTTYYILSTGSLLISIGAVVYILFYLKKMKKLHSLLDEDQQPANLEEILLALTSKLKKMESEQKKVKTEVEKLEEELSLVVQKVGVHRFNSVSDNGGNLSFCLALLNTKDTGITLTSFYGREQNRVYIKNINRGKSQNQLTPEEQNAIAEAHIKWNENRLKENRFNN